MMFGPYVSSDQSCKTTSCAYSFCLMCLLYMVFLFFSDDLDCTKELVKLNLVCKYVVPESDLHQDEVVANWLKRIFWPNKKVEQWS